MRVFASEYISMGIAARDLHTDKIHRDPWLRRLAVRAGVFKVVGRSYPCQNGYRLQKG